MSHRLADPADDASALSDVLSDALSDANSGA